LEVKVAREKELGNEMTPDEEIELFESEIRRMREASDLQIIVEEDQLENHLADGWQFVSILPSRRIFVKKTT